MNEIDTLYSLRAALIGEKTLMLGVEWLTGAVHRLRPLFNAAVHSIDVRKPEVKEQYKQLRELELALFDILRHLSVIAAA